MTRFDWLTFLISLTSLLIIPALVLLVRMTVRWTRTEDRLTDLIDDVKALVDDKERVHAEMYQTMREDRAATDRRLRWLEENLWRRLPPARRGQA